MKFLIYGGNGWIGKQIIEELQKQNHNVIIGKSRLEQRESILNEIQYYKPDRIINCAGKTGSPNVDWCEDHKEETIRSNVLGLINLIDCAFINNIHILNWGTGCIFEYDSEHKLNSGIGFMEDDKPNFDKSFYSKTKGLVEQIIKHYPNMLNLRLRMPIGDDLNPRNFITKIVNYEKVVNIPNSMSVLHDLIPISIDMSITKKTGIINFTNPGTISHNEILDLYKQYIDSEFKYTNFTLEEQSKILKAGRSNNELDSTKLLKWYPNIPHIKESIIEVFKRMQKNIN
jgi:nucleoside-diphosphate-sugar epimerase